jgi:predicted GNAT family acetyltransferase
VTDPAKIEVRDNPDKQRYDVFVDDQLAGYAAYRSTPGQLVFTHTKVDAAYEGHGVGSALARDALDDVRRRGLTVVPQCPFVSAYIRRHPDYLQLVDESERARLLS